MQRIRDTVKIKFIYCLMVVIVLIISPRLNALSKIDEVLVYKSQRLMKLMAGKTVVAQYRISLGANPIGHKQQQGDSRTPQGQYSIDYRNPHSRFYRSLHISYPNKHDRALARRRGVSPGGDIYIHGLPNGQGALAAVYSYIDWTDGCIAVSNSAMRVIWQRVKNGTPIRILP